MKKKWEDERLFNATTSRTIIREEKKADMFQLAYEIFPLI